MASPTGRRHRWLAAGRPRDRGAGSRARPGSAHAEVVSGSVLPAPVLGRPAVTCTPATVSEVVGSDAVEVGSAPSTSVRPRGGTAVVVVVGPSSWSPSVVVVVPSVVVVVPSVVVVVPSVVVVVPSVVVVVPSVVVVVPSVVVVVPSVVVVVPSVVVVVPSVVVVVPSVVVVVPSVVVVVAPVPGQVWLSRICGPEESGCPGGGVAHRARAGCVHVGVLGSGRR